MCYLSTFLLFPLIVVTWLFWDLYVCFFSSQFACWSVRLLLSLFCSSGIHEMFLYVFHPLYLHCSWHCTRPIRFGSSCFGYCRDLAYYRESIRCHSCDVCFLQLPLQCTSLLLRIFCIVHPHVGIERSISRTYVDDFYRFYLRHFICLFDYSMYTLSF